MENLIRTHKEKSIISAPLKADLEKYLDAIEAGIDFYLCRHPFKPILDHQAENIYFLKKSLKHLAIIEDLDCGFYLEFNLEATNTMDTETIGFIAGSIDNVIADINIDQRYNSQSLLTHEETIFFLLKLSQSLHSSFDIDRSLSKAR